MPVPQLTTLRAIPALADLPQNQLLELLRVASWRAWGAGEVIAVQSDEPEFVGFVISGFLKSVRGGAQRRQVAGFSGENKERRQRTRAEIMVALLGPGELVNEAGVLLRGTNSTTTIALTPCQLLTIPQQSFQSCLASEPGFALVVARRIARRQAEAERRIELMRASLEVRIRVILRECEELGLDAAKYLSNTEIARMAGATRVAVSPIMAHLRGPSRFKPTMP